MKNILIIDDEDALRKMLRIALTERGYTVFEASNGVEGIEVFRNTSPGIVLTDVNMPEMNGIEMTRKIKEINEDSDIIIMTGFGTEDLVIDAIRAGASNYIKKPLQFTELFSILDSIAFKREARKRYEVAKDVVEYEEKKIVMDNNMEKIWGVVNQVFYNVSNSEGQVSIEGLKLGLYEIIVNAVEHGNLEISYDEKKKALHENSYSDLLAERIKKANRSGKSVTVRSIFDRKKIEISVTDCGKGFDYSNLPDHSDPENILSAHGRGILLATVYYDIVEYKHPGNSVKLIKNL